MSSRRGKPTSVADNARREAKLLAKPQKLTLDPFGKTDVELKQPYPKELGEYAVIVIATPMTTLQFTIAHPIGVTDLSESAWVAHRSDQLQGMLARARDPNQSSLDQSRTAYRQQLATLEGLLVEQEVEGKKTFFYPHRDDMDRNQLLENARIKSKEATSQIKAQIDTLTDDKKHEKQGLITQLNRAADVLTHLDETTAMAEKELRKFYLKPEIISKITKEFPQKYRTLSGPYFTMPQVKIPGSDGLRLEDVAILFARSLARGDAVTTIPVSGLKKTEMATLVQPEATYSEVVADKVKPSFPPLPTGGTPVKEEETIDPVTGKKSLMSRLTGKTGKKGDTPGTT